LKGLQDVIICRGAEVYLEEALPQLKFVMNDRSQDVRATFFEILAHWLSNMEINSLRQYEHHFILYLLNGITDEYAEVSKTCKNLLEDHGNNMKDALKQMGIDEEEKMSIDEGQQ
jgi:hypothetical protein